MAMTPQEDETFAAFLRDKAMEAQRSLGYRPAQFLQMLGTMGGYRAAIALLSQPRPSEGFAKLWQGGRLDLSVEALVVESEWRSRFDGTLLDIAQRRLSDAGYAWRVSDSSDGDAEAMHPALAESDGRRRAEAQRSVPASASCVIGTQILPFVLGRSYSRNDVFEVLKLDPLPSGGPWFTGYTEHDGNAFIFCNVGAPGRTGHDYHNHFEGDHLVWFGKGPSRLRHASIRRLLSPEKHVYVFYRTGDRDPFTFAGTAVPYQAFDTAPVRVIWDFPAPLAASGTASIGAFPTAAVTEGASTTLTVKVYERDRGARLKCIAAWGWECAVCEFDFAMVYGELGVGFIHVHHVRPLSEVGQAHALDPVADLRPVCPNCHAMLHRSAPALSIEALKLRMRPAQ